MVRAGRRGRADGAVGVGEAVRIGVLALQGDFREHQLMLHDCGARPVPVRRPSDLEGLDGLIIPGGESTTMGRLMVDFGLRGPILRRAGEGMAVFGTCAGMVLMAKEAVGAARLGDQSQPLLGLMDLVVQRNGFGRQRESFEVDLAVPALGEEPLRAVFIRAPYVERAGRGVTVLASVDGKAVLCRQDRFLAAAFHPEVTDDARLHRYFLQEVVGS